jgi:hypothetical protein
MPCSQIQVAACSAPQLWPAIPGQPSTGTGAPPPTARLPSKTALGNGLSSLVRGSGARYIHSRGRWRSGSDAGRIARSQVAARPRASAPPRAPAGPNALSPIRIQPAGSATGSGSVRFTA